MTATGVEVEARFELGDPLVDQVRRAQHGEALDLAAVEQLARDERRLDRLADADVVGDQQPHRIELQRHQQRHELVGARLDGDLPEAAERAGAAAQRQQQRVAQEQRRVVAGLLVAASGGGNDASATGSASSAEVDAASGPPRSRRPGGRAAPRRRCR